MNIENHPLYHKVEHIGKPEHMTDAVWDRVNATAHRIIGRACLEPGAKFALDFGTNGGKLHVRDDGENVAIKWEMHGRYRAKPLTTNKDDAIVYARSWIANAFLFEDDAANIKGVMVKKAA